MPDSSALAGPSTPPPDSPSRNSLYVATANVEDLARSLHGFSRASTPEPGDDVDPEYTKAWLAVKSKLESRLVLSAEVGQALLQRHEAYVRKVQRERESRHEPSVDEVSIDELQEFDDEPRSRAELETRVADLVRENAVLERRANQSMVNAEVAESANKDLQTEVQELKATVSRLNMDHARAVGWEGKLRAVAQERDDLRQERDAEATRARVTETRLVSLGDKNAELRAQIRQLTDSVDAQYQQRQELSEVILHDAKSRLAKIQATVRQASSMANDGEVTHILESLVEDNEGLLQSNAELQSMLADTREELHTLQEEAEEYRAAANFSPYEGTIHDHTSRPGSRMHRSLATSSRMTYGTAPGPISPLSSAFSIRGRGHKARRSSSIEIPRREYELATPPAGVRSLSPDSLDGADTTMRSMGIAISEDYTLVGDAVEKQGSGLTQTSPKKRRASPLRRQRGVQTEDLLGPALSTFQPFSDMSSSVSPHDGLSESSSLVDPMSTLSALLERLGQLLSRIQQADALTLTTRLKRQNLVGADVSYISRSSVESIVSEVAGLRLALRGALEDDKFATTCTRKDLRALLKLARDLFRELGTLRVTLNDIVLDPSLAPKVRDMVFNPEKAVDTTAGAGASSSWIAPLTKLFGGNSSGSTPSSEPPRFLSPLGPGTRPSPTSRPSVPKAVAAPSASTTTVNVEFTGSGAGRAITDSSNRRSRPSPVAAPAPRQASSNLMGIFAGAPKPAEADPWVVVKAATKLRPKTPGSAASPMGRSSSNRSNEPKPMAAVSMSRNVSAMIDAPATPAEASGSGFDPRLLEQARTLRPRGLSDSSIRTTFLQHADAPPQEPAPTPAPAPASRQTMFQTLSRRVGAFRAPEPAEESGSTSTHAPGHSRQRSGTLPRALAPNLARLLPDLAWGGGDEFEPTPVDAEAYVGSFRQRDPLVWARGGRTRDM
ncbi:hypothetical protein PENSPDRAFT_624479 [Peniophora sp. CONT]|nr:hypothetical protein PENSPDRAFT_624479 [Peniophora sp. CONT]